jgi:uncharacterized protein YhaN|tara:strand:- start:137 stop:592 length:456 start_codon:yes stop_codon:yes gene_type:complete
MKNKIIAQILSLSLLFPATIFAEEVDDPKFTQLEQGEEAPFAGTLFNPAATAKLIADHQYSLLECDLRVQYEIDRARADMRLQLDSLQISYNALDERHKLLMDIKNNEIDTYREMALNQPNDNSHWWLLGGVVAGIGLSLGTFYAVTEINE